MTQIRLVYVDDTLDTSLSEYLDEHAEDDLRESLGTQDVSLSYAEVTYDPSAGFRSLLQNRTVQNANVIIMDSKLFETSTPPEGMLSGETFRVLLRRYYPFIEVIVITQNADRDRPGMGMVHKYYWRNGADPSDPEGPSKYYRDELIPPIAAAVRNVMAYRLQFERLEEELGDKAMLEKVSNSIEGLELYDELSKTDIDELVEAFKKLSDAIERDTIG